MPQGLLIMAFIMNLLILTLNSQLMILAPQYTTLGSQSYQDNNTKTLCSISEMRKGFVARWALLPIPFFLSSSPF